MPGHLRTASRRLRLVGVVLALALGLLLAGAGAASAHATLIATDPADGAVLPQTPDVVTLTFSEPVSLSGDDAIQVFDAAGETVAVDASSQDADVVADLPDTLDDGTYAVTYRLISADGHPISGSLSFSVGAPSEQVAAPTAVSDSPRSLTVGLGVVQGIGYLGLLLAAGLAIFGTLVLGRDAVAEPARRRLTRLGHLSTGVAVLGWLLLLPLQGAYQRGEGWATVPDPAALDLGTLSDELVVTGLVCGALLLAAGVELVVRRSAARPGSEWRVSVAALAAVAAMAPSLSGHTRVFTPEILMITADAAHLLAGAVWLGGLTGLALVLGGLARRPVEAARLLARFSGIGAVVLVAVAVTGLLQALRIVGTWSNLFGQTYGVLLLVKVGVVGIVALVAAWNRFRLLPQVADAQRSAGFEQRRAAVGLVRRTVSIEAVGLVAVLGLTGFLVESPPRPAEDGPAAAADETAATPVTSIGLGDHAALVTLAPGRRGPNTVQVQIQDDQGEPVDVVAAPELVIRSADGSGGSDGDEPDDPVDLGRIGLSPVAAGTYQGNAVLPRAGVWELQVSLRISEFDSPVGKAEVEIE